MGRYDNTGIRKNKNNKTCLRTNIIPEIVESDDDIQLISTEGDRFDILASLYYGDPHMWWYLAKANKMVTMNISPGTSIRIPIDQENK